MTRQKSSVHAKQSVEEAFEQILRADLTHIQIWSPIAIEGEDIEGVHQMRVGLRRMRSTLAIFSPTIPHKVTKKLAREMRWAGQQLDRARDLDVYIEDNLPFEEVKRDKRKIMLRKVALKNRQKVYKQVEIFIKSRRFNALNEEISHWLKTKGWQQGLSKKERYGLKQEVTRFSAQVLDERHCKVLEAGRKIQQMDDEMLHHLRIDCKKLRYASEFFSPLYGKEMASFLQQLKELQDVLGLLHDCSVMETLQNSLLKGKKAKKLTGVANKVLDQRKRSALDFKQILLKAWGSFIATRLPCLKENVSVANS